MYQAEETSASTTRRIHKEEVTKGRKLHSDDRKRMANELSKHSHPLSTKSTELFNIVNGKVADESINVADALPIGQVMAHSFKVSLPEGFHNPIKKKVKTLTLEALKKGVKIGSKTAYDIEALFSHLFAWPDVKHQP